MLRSNISPKAFLVQPDPKHQTKRQDSTDLSDPATENPIGNGPKNGYAMHGPTWTCITGENHGHLHHMVIQVLQN